MEKRAGDSHVEMAVDALIDKHRPRHHPSGLRPTTNASTLIRATLRPLGCHPECGGGGATKSEKVGDSGGRRSWPEGRKENPLTLSLAWLLPSLASLGLPKKWMSFEKRSHYGQSPSEARERSKEEGARSKLQPYRHRAARSLCRNYPSWA